MVYEAMEKDDECILTVYETLDVRPPRRLITCNDPFNQEPFEFLLVPGTLCTAVSILIKLSKSGTYCRLYCLACECCIKISRCLGQFLKIACGCLRVQYLLCRCNLNLFLSWRVGATLHDLIEQYIAGV